MGNNSSQSSHSKTKTKKGSVSAPKSMSYSQLKHAAIMTSREHFNKTHIRKVPFFSVWSMEASSSIDVPSPRMGHFSACSYKLNLGVIGFGEDQNKNILNDVWTYNLATLKLSKLNLTGDNIIPRTGARAVFDDNDMMYIFGGANGTQYFNDLFKIDVQTGVCSQISASGYIPSPRNSPVLAHYKNKLFVWGGYDGDWPSDLFILDLASYTWKNIPQNKVKGRTGTSFCVFDSKIYIYASSKSGGIIMIDMVYNTVQQLKTCGDEPDCDVLSAALFIKDDYIILIGGKNQPEFTNVYACNVNRLQWFKFFVVPDEETVNEDSGKIDENGDFLIPRISSVAVSFSKIRGSILTFLGNPMIDPPSFNLLEIREPMAILHHRDDIMNMLCCDSVKIERL